MEATMTAYPPRGDVSDYPFVWYWRSRLPERKGQRCRVRCRGALNSIAVEFEDGSIMCTSRYAVRSCPATVRAQGAA
jgi:hypothetical protein